METLEPKSSRTEDVGVQEFIAELAARVVARTQLNELRQLFILGFQLRGWHGEELSPVRTGFEWREFLFNDRQQFPDGGPVLLPSEVNCDTRLFVARTHPKTVSSNGTNLSNQ